MPWAVASLIAAGLVLGCTFRAAMLLVGSAAIVAYGALTGTEWQTWLMHLAVFQGAYLGALMISTAWTRRAEAGRRRDRA